MNEKELMLTSVLDCRRIDLATGERALTPAQKLRYDQMQSRRAKGEPLQYIIGHCDFMGVPLTVDPRALIPRPETEILVDLVLNEVKVMSKEKALKALDLGVGSGNITVALLKNIENMTMTAVDVSDDALVLAEENAIANDVDGRVRFLCDDMGWYLSQAACFGRKFDIIITNPPYIPTEQLTRLPEDVQCEPRLALDGGADGLMFFTEIIECGWKLLNAQGVLAMEIGDGQRDAIETIFAQYPQYTHIDFYKDYVGTDRVVIARVGE